jgi:hypothetical protein
VEWAIMNYFGSAQTTCSSAYLFIEENMNV